MTATAITKLELRSVPIPRSPTIERLEQELGRPLLVETRHYLDDRPVHCGDFLELYVNGQWIPGRYEWTFQLNELPTFHYDGGVIRIGNQSLVRWPE